MNCPRVPFNVKPPLASLRRQDRGQRPPEFQPGQLPDSNTACRDQKISVGLLRQWPKPWAGDITYLRTDEGWLYLAVVIDLWSRAVIGHSMSPRMTAQLP